MFGTEFRSGRTGKGMDVLSPIYYIHQKQRPTIILPSKVLLLSFASLKILCGCGPGELNIWVAHAEDICWFLYFSMRTNVERSPDDSVV